MVSPQLLTLHRAMHHNLRALANAESKSPAALFESTIKSSAECVLSVAETLGVALEDRIELLYEAGRYEEARTELNLKLQQGNWLERFLNNRRYGAIVREVRRAVAMPSGTPTPL